MPSHAASTPAGFLLVLVIVLPIAGVVLGLLLGARRAERTVLVLLPAGLAVAIAVAVVVIRSESAVIYVVGAWAPPLGLAFRADGASAAMLVTTALVIAATAIFARAQFGSRADHPEERAPLVFWTLLPALWAAINCVLIGEDLFNLYVALELLTFAAMPLVSLDGRAETMAAALRYLLFALLGSVLYLLGVALLYGTYATLDILLLSVRTRSDAATLAAGALMTVGLLAKTALFPLHLWLPPAHAGAPAPASAVLSALVVKASFFLVLRVWFGVMPGLLGTAVPQLLAALGTAAILAGGVLALRQARLKLLVAYSTVAQIGYLFLMFPLVASSVAAGGGGGEAWMGGILQAVSHAFAKAAMFMTAGLIAEALGHDRISDLGGIGRAMPISVGAFALAGLSLMGVPPSGGFIAKWLLLTSAIGSGQWWWALVIVGGGLLTGGYVYRVLAGALAGAARPAVTVARSREMIGLSLALVSVALGMMPLWSLGLVQIGRADFGGGALP